MDSPAPTDRIGRPVLAYLLALAAAGAAFLLRWLFEPWLHGQLPFVTMFGAVAISVWLGGVGPAIVAAVVGFLTGGLWMLEPKGPIDLFNATYLIALLGYGFSCGLIIAFGETLRRIRRRLEGEVGQRRRAEALSRESDQHYRFTVELHPQVTWTARADGMLDRVAERWREWTGASGLGESWSQNIHPDDRDATLRAWAHSIATGGPYDVEHRVRLGSGEYRWARSRAFPRRDEHGAVLKWYGTTEDIHVRKLAEAELGDLNTQLEEQIAARTVALQASEARMRTIFSTSLQYQGLLAVDGSLLDANATSLRGIERRLEDVIGAPFWETPWFSQTPGMPEIVRQGVLAAAAGESVRREIAVNLPAGTRYFDFAMRPVRGADGSVVAIVPEAVDVTERRHAEESLRQAHKMEAVGQLTGGVAHDFNNMLQVISSNLHLVSRYVPDNEKVQSRLSIAQGAVGRGARLASQLLAFGRRQALEPKVVNAGRFVTGLEDMLRRTLGGSVEVEIVVPGGLWNTFVDPTQIENAVLNLAINGRDAMDGSGKLTIEVANAYLDEAYVREVADLKPGHYVLIAVSDTGAGMTSDVIAKAFEPFFSTKPVGSGTGLGLSMVYGFVKQSGGHVRIYSEVGYGTTIKLYLPRVSEGEDVLTPPESGQVSGGMETILVVEDDDAVRAATVEMLDELGYRVLRASDAASALAILASGVAVDLLFTDVVMPGPLKSTDLASKARDRRPEIAVLFTSGYTCSAIVHGGRLDEGVELLAKPFTLDALARRVRAVLGDPRRRPFSRSSRAEPPPAEADAGALTVLVVEDDDLVRSSTAEMVRDLGHVVHAAHSAEQAMVLLRSRPIDVLLADLGLPGMSGEVFAAEARALQPDLRIVFATGADRLPELGGAGPGPIVLRKPYDSGGISAALRASSAARPPGDGAGRAAPASGA